MSLSLQFKVVVVCVVLYVCKGQVLRKEAYATVPQLITAAGYPVEKHRATTADGYMLQIFRIPAGRRSARRSGPAVKGKKAVMLVSGLLGSAGDFVIMGPKKSLSFMLADAGYDVWLANLRGTVYSAHKNLTKNNPVFWDYGFHEHGRYDAPAIIDKILNVTGLPKILYVGYSMGTTTFFTMMSQWPEYNEKLVAFVALAPAVYMDNIRPLMTLILKDLDLIGTVRRRGLPALAFPIEMLSFVASLCSAREPAQDMCMRIIYSIVGEDYDQHDWDMTQILIARSQPVSFRQLEHFGKIALTGVFTEWADGLDGKVVPYNLDNVKIPVSLRYGENDQLTEKSQIMRLADHLNRTGVLETISPGCYWPKFNHLDFAIAKDVGEMLNKPLVAHIGQLFNKYYKE